MSHDGHHSVVIPAPGPEFVPHTVAHHFDTPVQEFQAAKLGFWLFLATEILLFGGLFLAAGPIEVLLPAGASIGVYLSALTSANASTQRVNIQLKPYRK